MVYALILAIICISDLYMRLVNANDKVRVCGLVWAFAGQVCDKVLAQ